MTIPVGIQAGLWGLLAGGALVLGAAIAWFVRVPQRLIAGVMAFGAGVLISALAFELMDEACQRGGFDATAIGFLGGGAVTMVPEAFEQAHDATGLITVAGFLAAFLLSKLGG